MTLNVALALMIGCVLGVFSTIIIVGFAFAVREYKQEKKAREEFKQHE